MAPSRLILGALCAILATPVAAVCPSLKPATNLVTVKGVEYKLLVNNLRIPRHIVVDTEGNLVFTESGLGVRRVVLDDGEGLNVCVKSNARLIQNDKFNGGIALSSDGKTLFASSSTDVYAYPYNARDGTVGSAKNVITGMKQDGEHQVHSLLVPRGNPDLLLVTRGSVGNIDKESVNKDSARAQIRTFRIGSIMQRDSPTPYSDGGVLGWGLRNSVGIGEDVSTGNIWSVDNSIDNMKRDGQDIHNDNPGEELNFHGRPGDTGGAMYGKNFGYPSCVSIRDADAVRDYPGGAEVGMPMTGDHTDSKYDDTFCKEQTVPARLTFGAHMAPLDVKFQENGAAAFVTFHGGWNRWPPQGYKLSRIAFGPDGQPRAPRNSQDPEQRILWNREGSQCPNECIRPVGLAIERSGRLFLTNDKDGELYVLTGVTV